MKKSHILSLFFVLCLILASCGNHVAAPTEHSSTSENTATATEMTVAVEHASAPSSPPAGLSDYDLYDTVFFQILDLVDSYPSESAALEDMTQAQRVFYILSIYDMEMQCGGLCQFFVNCSPSLPPYVEQCLETVGADEHKELFIGFVTENQIDLSDLDSFVIYDLDDYAAQTERYDYEAFDMSYYELPPLFDYLVEYIHSNPKDF